MQTGHTKRVTCGRSACILESLRQRSKRYRQNMKQSGGVIVRKRYTEASQAYQDGNDAALLQALLDHTTYLEGCFLWCGHTDQTGNPRWRIDNQNFYVRRLVWALSGNEPVYRLNVFCKRKLCINPEHFYSGRRPEVLPEQDSDEEFFRINI